MPEASAELGGAARRGAGGRSPSTPESSVGSASYGRLVSAAVPRPAAGPRRSSPAVAHRSRAGARTQPRRRRRAAAAAGAHLPARLSSAPASRRHPPPAAGRAARQGGGRPRPPTPERAAAAEAGGAGPGPAAARRRPGGAAPGRAVAPPRAQGGTWPVVDVGAENSPCRGGCLLFPSEGRGAVGAMPAQGSCGSRAGVNLLSLGSPKGLGKDGWELSCFACRTVGMLFLRKWGWGGGWNPPLYFRLFFENTVLRDTVKLYPALFHFLEKRDHLVS